MKNHTKNVFEQVSKITNTVYPTGKGDTYVRWNGGTIDDLEKLVEIEACDVQDCQNDSPSIGELLDDLEDYKDKVELIGYVIYPPRSDARVSVEGFNVIGLTADEALHFYEKYGNADEKTTEKTENSYNIRFWWD